MAILERINYQPMVFNSLHRVGNDSFFPNDALKSIKSFPHIFFSNGEPWREANRYAFYRYHDLQKDLKTINREMTHLVRYADWLENTGVHWLHFPKKKRERCLFRYKGYLLELRNSGLLAPSTTSQNMNSVIAFYRWASVHGYASERPSLFDDEIKVISFFDKVGFKRTMGVLSSELSIPNRMRTGNHLEDGLTPISQVNTEILMNHLSEHRNYELYLMAKVALQTGCRHETVTTLNLDALKSAYPDQMITGTMRVKVGPGTGVKTKFDVSGEVYFSRSLIDELINYFYSAEAILRRSKANEKMQRNIFLTSRGNRYTTETFGTLIFRLKEELIKKGHSQFGRFKFHQLRATFGTMLMRELLKIQSMSNLNAIEIVQEALLHKDASTTWKYIKFIEKEPIEEQLFDALWSMFTGSKTDSNLIIDSFTNGEMFDAT
ncbi:site-specific integrase [Pseudoalteromonas shioyasakiensis]|nr:site-specific integrase [Pseudoalteromonas shioyasakiensis]